MKPKILLTLASIYLGLLGLGLLLFPRQVGIEAVPADASPALIAYVRLFGGPCLGIAVLNWMTRNDEPSPSRNAVIVGNLVGFGCVALNDVWGVFSGQARRAASVFLVIHLAFAIGFLLAARATRRIARA